MSYLDPKNDLTFKKIFGEHPDILKSFLNALMPFEDGRVIETLTYLPIEQVPRIPKFKNSLVDVKCCDNFGRHFIIEMQMYWTKSFPQRVVFNASKTYVQQIKRGNEYNLLEPVYSLNLINGKYISNDDEFYHHYKIQDIKNSEYQLKGLEFIFIELPKFNPYSFNDKKMMVLWLRFLTEIKDKCNSIPDGIDATKEIHKAIEILEESAFSPNELIYYDNYWDVISRERTVQKDSYVEGHEKGHEKGREEGREEERILQEDKLINTVINLLQNNVSIEVIISATGFSADEIGIIKERIS